MSCWCNYFEKLRSERDKWTESNIHRLISLYRKNPCLWNKDLTTYLDSKTRHKAYNKIHRNMRVKHLTFIEVILKIRELRKIYIQELKELLLAHDNNQCYRPKVPWFYDLHKFLYPFLEYNEVIQINNCEAGDSHTDTCCSYGGNREDPSSVVEGGGKEAFDPCLTETDCDEVPRESTCDETQNSAEISSFSERTTPVLSQRDERDEEDAGLSNEAEKCFVNSNSASLTYTIPSVARSDSSRSDFPTRNWCKCDERNKSVGYRQRFPQKSKQKNPNPSTLKRSKKLQCTENFEKEFDSFGRKVASELKRMSLEDALKAQSQIKKILRRSLRKSKMNNVHATEVLNAEDVVRERNVVRKVKRK